MANDDWIAARGGMLPMEYPYGAFRKNVYKLTTSAVAVYMGQPMDMDANGNAVPAGTGTGTTINFLLGPVVGFIDPNQAGLPSAMFSLTQGPYLPALTDANVLIADDPDQIFIMQVNTDGTAMTTAGLGNAVTFAYRSSSGNNTTGYSTAEVSELSFTISGTGNLQVLGLLPLKNSDGSTNTVGDLAKVKVRILTHRFGFRGLMATI